MYDRLSRGRAVRDVRVCTVSFEPPLGADLKALNPWQLDRVSQFPVVSLHPMGGLTSWL